MDKEILFNIFNKQTSGKNYDKGRRIFENDLVSSLTIKNDENLIYIDASVISEGLFNEYSTKIEIDLKNKSIFSTYCSCKDYEKNEFKKTNYCCKHLVATFYKALDDLIKNPLLSGKSIKSNNIFKRDDSELHMLLGDEDDKEEIKIEVYLNKTEWDRRLKVDFKIGVSSMSSRSLYILKDIDRFLLSYDNKIPITYSKNFTFNVRNQKFNIKDKRLIDFIKTLRDIENTRKYINRNSNKCIDGKYIIIPDYLVRNFFEVISSHRVYLNDGFFYREIQTEILFENPPINFSLELKKDKYILKIKGGMPTSLTSKNDVFLYGSTIYLSEYDFCYKIRPYIEVFNKDNSIDMEMSDEDMILRKLIPDLNFLSPYLALSRNIKDKIVVDECGFNFYFDREHKDITLIVKVIYGKIEFNTFDDYKEKIIYRDIKNENGVLNLIRSLGFISNNKKFYFTRDEDSAFLFFKNDINKLQKIGDVYYSENFKGIKSITKNSIRADIRQGKYDYFEMKFEIKDIDSKEISDILKAFRDNVKYYKLKNGEYIDLEELELKNFLRFLNAASSERNIENNIHIPKSKGIFLENFIEENGIRYIKGKNELKKIKDKFKKISKLEFKEPKELKANLREYQKVGYNWFKTIEYFGFGGILGDEMGLGKTVQTIAFLLSNKQYKSLIIVPTSLIYNWINEFEKFAPSLKVKALNGQKEEREEEFKNVSDYDVIITTYNLLKNDIDIYNKFEFDCLILDEAQFIKNPSSQNALAAKKIKARLKFALSGTPIENSVMELWSIFDFIMPGYLYDEKTFSVKYYKRFKEEPCVLDELNKLISPFILRRRKEDVMKELPRKIEKKFMVTLDDEQKKVYKIYADYAMNLIKKKVQDDEFKSSKIEILSYITKLRQLCLDPSVIIKDYNGGSGKMKALVELLEKSTEQGHRILVFSQFTSVLKKIGKAIDACGIPFSYLDGTMSSEKRINIVKKFNEGYSSVFLISLKAGGTGLNLTSADVVIHFDPWWNPAVEEQATDRAHRIGQKKVVEVIKIIAKGTIEEKIIQLQEEKKKLISELMGDELSGEKSFANLSENEILELFNM
ncbi:ATP-dependent helicase [Clostridium fermenticellae]|uniref:ATP-dependent helicase n=1 Tax=Clostridium fermenticellae TaxID=2068654 RepID=A0A386H4I8_9CLOT|nr:SNF2 helicase associated domain-containing protein [Clostridium fermenticellae]AYD40405.1 ATP-dependent helicase [Clostridium fermenticellae]